MNIMQICSGGGLNGAAYSTLLLTRELARRGHRLFMVCPRGAWIGRQVAAGHCCHFQLHWMFNDYVIAVSEATRRYHVAYNLVRRARSETIYNFIDYRRMSEIPSDARRRTRSWLFVSAAAAL